jgi:predicted DNA-binding transcriptional regulator YafY
MTTSRRPNLAFNKNLARSRVVTIDYTNWRGERGTRRVIPISIVFTYNEWHPEQQWLCIATDVAKNEKRFFAMANIHSWTPE